MYLFANSIPTATASFRLPISTLRKIDVLCARTNSNRSQILRRCLAQYAPINEIPDEPPVEPSSFSYPGWLMGANT